MAFAGQLVFADLGQLFAFDGTKLTNLAFALFVSQGRYQGSPQSLSLFQATEGHLLAVNQGGDVMMTNGLATWSCIGKAPADATSIGSLDGVVYFGDRARHLRDQSSDRGTRGIWTECAISDLPAAVQCKRVRAAQTAGVPYNMAR